MLIAGNWKMNLKYEDILKLKDILTDFKLDNRVEMAILPQSPLLYSAQEYLSNYNIKIGAQTCSSELRGAFTGDVSVEIISDIGCKYCLVGHSERREFHNETNDFVKKASTLLLTKNIVPIICVGESLEIRNKNITRMIGIQGVFTESIYQSCTKSVKTCHSPEIAICEIEKSIDLIKSGRYGPSIVDIPIDVQGSKVNIHKNDYKKKISTKK